MALDLITSALKPLAGLPDDPANDDYSSALSDLKSSIKARQSGGGLDPSMLALAAGFLGSTKSGSTGESIQNAIGAYLPAKQAQEKQAQEDALLRLQIAQTERQQNLKAGALKSFLGSSGVTPLSLIHI